jgi:tetratricopeptide (TPR) repeat protein
MPPTTGKTQLPPDSPQELARKLAILEEKISRVEAEISSQKGDTSQQVTILGSGYQEHTQKLAKIDQYLIQVDQYIKDISYEIGGVVRSLTEVQNHLKLQAENLKEVILLLRSQVDREKSSREALKQKIEDLSRSLEIELKKTDESILAIGKKLETLIAGDPSQFENFSAQANSIGETIKEVTQKINQDLSKLGRSPGATTSSLGKPTSFVPDEVVELRSLDNEFDDVIYTIQSSMTDLAAVGLEANRIRQLKKQEEDNQRIGFLIQEAETLFAQNHYYKSLQILEEARKISPNHPQLNLMLANTYIQMGDLTSAENRVSSLLNFPDPPAKANLLLGNIRLLENDVATAILLMEKAKAQSPEDPEVYLLLGKAYNKDQQVIKAIECWEKVQALKPSLLENEAEIRILLDENRRISGSS